MDFVIQNLGKIILITGAIAGLVMVLKNYAKIKKFVMEVRTELTKVSWSNRQELMSSTAVVIGITSIMALFIGTIDILLSKILSLVFK